MRFKYVKFSVFIFSKNLYSFHMLGFIYRVFHKSDHPNFQGLCLKIITIIIIITIILIITNLAH